MEVTRAAELRKLVQSKGFTPGRKDVGPLLALLAEADDDEAKHVLSALQRRPDVALVEAARALPAAPVPARPYIARLLGALGGTLAIESLLLALFDPDERTRRASARALGNMQDARIEPALVERIEARPSPAELRVLSAALGKVGGAGAKERLQALAEDPELARVAGRAALLAERRAARDEGGASAIDPTGALERPVPFVFRCRAGLVPLLVSEIEELGLGSPVSALGDAAAVVRGATAPLARALASRVALDVAIRLPRVPGRDAEAIAAALTGPVATEVLSRWTHGVPTFRLSWAGGGHKRALAWDVSALVARSGASARSDPRQALWEARVHASAAGTDVDLVPLGPLAARFAYRVSDVPAASHPTIAAALVRLAGAQPDDVVWDPFVGSGTELVERALRGPARLLVGTDLDPAAIEAATANLAAAGVSARLELADARTFEPPPDLRLVISNPPLGRRVRRDVGLQSLLDAVLDRAAASLARGGRLVWVSPSPERTRARARAAGLHLSRAYEVDMGGFSSEIQRFDRR